MGRPKSPKISVNGQEINFGGRGAEMGRAKGFAEIYFGMG
jgi:hypothetical protein